MLTQFFANPQGEAIYAGTLDCFTLRVRNDGRDNLNGTRFIVCFREKNRKSY
jgi:hypothetical protein